MSDTMFGVIVVGGLSAIVIVLVAAALYASSRRTPIAARPWHLKLETIDEALDGVAQRIGHLEGWNRSHRERAAEWKSEARVLHRELVNAHKGIRRLKRRNDRLENILLRYRSTFGELDEKRMVP